VTTILHNAFIYTADAQHRCIPDGALVHSGGRIDWVGPSADLPPFPGAQRRDMSGRVIMPGLVNTHAHGGLSIHRGVCDDGDLFQWATALAPHTSAITLEDNRFGCYLAVFEMVRNGITTACDCARYGAGIFSEVASAIGMRSLSGSLANSPGLRRAGKPNWPDALNETKAAMAKRAGDGLSRFYLGAHSPYNCTPELLVEVKAAARELALPFTIHVAENRKELDIVRERHGARPIQHLDRLGVLDRGTILAHCVWLDDGDIEILRRTGAGVAHNPISNGKLASGIAPIRTLRQAGVPVGLGTDSTLSNNSLSIFQEMKVAVLLQRASSLDGYALSARDALAMATREGASVLSWVDEIGSLEAGKQADYLVLEIDHPLGLTPDRVMSDLVFAVGPQQVRAAVVAGRAVFEDGRFTQVDERAIRDRIRRHYANALP
jgi:5-methylthioadenosine/S-adenosylhomocysteine deaminase